MPEIVILPNGSLLIPRSAPANNQFYSKLLEDMVTEETRHSLEVFFAMAEDSEIIVGSPGLCG